MWSPAPAPCSPPTASSTVASATADIGTGTYTILTQIAADALGLPMEEVTLQARRLLAAGLRPSRAARDRGLGRLSRPGGLPRGAREAVRDTPGRSTASPLANASLEHVDFAGGRIALAGIPPGPSPSRGDAAGGVDRIEAEETDPAEPCVSSVYSSYTHSAIFAEVRSTRTSASFASPGS